MQELILQKFTHRLILLETGPAKYWGILACIASNGVSHYNHHPQSPLSKLSPLTSIIAMVKCFAHHHSTTVVRLLQTTFSLACSFIPAIIITNVKCQIATNDPFAGLLFHICHHHPWHSCRSSVATIFVKIITVKINTSLIKERSVKDYFLKFMTSKFSEMYVHGTQYWVIGNYKISLYKPNVK